jgi:5-formyltetrahydrofolate cyclo-ligase
LRQTLRARRRALPRWTRQLASRRLAVIAKRQHWFRHSRTLALYIANDAEIDPMPLSRIALAAGKRVLLPRLRQKRLEFVAYRPNSTLQRNRFNIPEPIGAPVPKERIDVVCVPLVGFDRHGQRLGMGGGFYDRTFSGRMGKNRQNARGPRLVGLAYGCQEVRQLPHENWDVRLEGVVTEREWIQMP